MLPNTAFPSFETTTCRLPSKQWLEILLSNRSIAQIISMRSWITKPCFLVYFLVDKKGQNLEKSKQNDDNWCKSNYQIMLFWFLICRQKLANWGNITNLGRVSSNFAAIDCVSALKLSAKSDAQPACRFNFNSQSCFTIARPAGG